MNRTASRQHQINVMVVFGILEQNNSFYSYLALVSALMGEADYVFIPEDPAVPEWKTKLCDKLKQVYRYITVEKSQIYISYLVFLKLDLLQVFQKCILGGINLLKGAPLQLTFK